MKAHSSWHLCGAVAVTNTCCSHLRQCERLCCALRRLWRRRELLNGLFFSWGRALLCFQLLQAILRPEVLSVSKLSTAGSSQDRQRCCDMAKQSIWANRHLLQILSKAVQLGKECLPLRIHMGSDGAVSRSLCARGRRRRLGQSGGWRRREQGWVLSMRRKFPAEAVLAPKPVLTCSRDPLVSKDCSCTLALRPPGRLSVICRHAGLLTWRCSEEGRASCRAGRPPSILIRMPHSWAIVAIIWASMDPRYIASVIPWWSVDFLSPAMHA